MEIEEEGKRKEEMFNQGITLHQNQLLLRIYDVYIPQNIIMVMLNVKIVEMIV